MSSKAVGQQQQGRRTPLSLTGGKHNHQQQNQNNVNKGNHNSNNNAAKNQEPKDSTSNNKNKNQQETRDLTSTQNNSKRNQQNGSKHVTADDGNDDIIIVEQNGTANGSNSNNNGAQNKGNTRSNNQASNKDTKEKEKQSEPVKEKQEQKSKKGETSKAAEKKQNEANEKGATTATPPPNANKSKDGTSTPTPNAAAVEKKQNAQPSTPAKANTPSNAHRKSNTPSKLDNADNSTVTPTSKSPVTAATKTATPSKPPKGAGTAVIAPVTEVSPEVIEIDENEIEPLIVESSPQKKSTERHAIAPAATSTPGKPLGKRGDNVNSEKEFTMETRGAFDRKSVPRSYSDISGRRSIRCNTDYTPSMYNAQYRESYRRINTELDVTSNTNTSMNVTVGSEIPNNSSFLSFSLFGRGRKRERTPPQTVPGKSQSAVELTMETTPPKRARLDVHGIFSAMSSPLTMLRTRFSKATLETPSKNQQPNTADDVQNVSGVSIEEVVSSAEVTATEDITVGKEAIAEQTPTKPSPVKEKEVNDSKELQADDDAKGAAMDVDGDIKITETPIIPAVGEPKGKQRGCSIM